MNLCELIGYHLNIELYDGMTIQNAHFVFYFQAQAVIA